MRFPNAYDGVKKIYTAEILSIVAGVLGILTAIMGVFAAAALTTGTGGGMLAGLVTGAGAGVLGFIMLILMIVAFIMNILGVSSASKDEEMFSQAMMWIIIGIVVNVASTLLGGIKLLSGLLGIVSTFASFMVTYSVLKGIISISSNICDSAVAAAAENSVRFLMLTYLLSAVFGLVGTILSSFGTGGGILAAILTVIEIVFQLVSYFIYFGVLGKAKDMLASV